MVCSRLRRVFRDYYLTEQSSNCFMYEASAQVYYTLRYPSAAVVCFSCFAHVSGVSRVATHRVGSTFAPLSRHSAQPCCSIRRRTGYKQCGGTVQTQSAAGFKEARDRSAKRTRRSESAFTSCMRTIEEQLRLVNAESLNGSLDKRVKD